MDPKMTTSAEASIADARRRTMRNGIMGLCVSARAAAWQTMREKGQSAWTKVV